MSTRRPHEALFHTVLVAPRVIAHAQESRWLTLFWWLHPKTQNRPNILRLHADQGPVLAAAFVVQIVGRFQNFTFRFRNLQQPSNLQKHLNPSSLLINLHVFGFRKSCAGYGSKSMMCRFQNFFKTANTGQTLYFSQKKAALYNTIYSRADYSSQCRFYRTLVIFWKQMLHRTVEGVHDKNGGRF